jgi:hypothetical protein
MIMDPRIRMRKKYPDSYYFIKVSKKFHKKLNVYEF